MTFVDNSTHVTRDLSINQTQLADAGVYLCAELVAGVDIRDPNSAQLIVLGSYWLSSINSSD